MLFTISEWQVQFGVQSTTSRMGYVTGPCYDLLAPPLASVNGALPEHLYWDAVPSEGLHSLAGTAGVGLHEAQACAAKRAITSLETQLVAVESSVGFSRYHPLLSSHSLYTPHAPPAPGQH